MIIIRFNSIDNYYALLVANKLTNNIYISDNTFFATNDKRDETNINIDNMSEEEIIDYLSYVGTQLKYNIKDFNIYIYTDNAELKNKILTEKYLGEGNENEGIIYQ